MRKTIFIITIVFALFSCAVETKVDRGKTVIVDYTDNYIKMSEFSDNYNTICLFPSSNDGVINKIDRVAISDSLVYVLDRHVNQIMSFTKEGKFISSTKKYIGKGHNEYIGLIDAAFDLNKGLIYVLCDSPYCIMVFDTNLVLKDKITLDFYVDEAVVAGEYLYCLRKNNNDRDRYEILKMNIKSLGTTYEVICSSKNNVIGLKGMGKSLTVNNDTVYVSFPFTHQIYKIFDGEVCSKYIIDFGENLASDLNKNLSYQEFLKHNSNKEWIIQNITIDDSQIYFNTNRYYFYKINRESNKCIAYRELINDNFPVSSTNIIPSQSRNNILVLEILPELAEKYINHVVKNKVRVNNNIFKQMEECAKSGNPMLVIRE